MARTEMKGLVGMTRRTSVAGFAGVALLIMGIGTAWSLDEPPFTTGGLWPDMKCKNLPGCPAGFAKNINGNYAGCHKLLWSACIGSCTSCAGSTTPGAFCSPSESVQCVVGIGNPVPCGAGTTFDDCYYSATAPPGEPFPTPNSCYCRGAAAPGPACTAQQCTGTSTGPPPVAY